MHLASADAEGMEKFSFTLFHFPFLEILSDLGGRGGREKVEFYSLPPLARWGREAAASNEKYKATSN